MNLHNILKQPHITEKTLDLATKENIFTFEVNKSANKYQIKKAIEEQFKVSVVNIKTNNLPGKSKRKGKTRSTIIQTSPRKKASVKLKEGDKIDLFELGG